MAVWEPFGSVVMVMVPVMSMDHVVVSPMVMAILYPERSSDVNLVVHIARFAYGLACRSKRLVLDRVARQCAGQSTDGGSDQGTWTGSGMSVVSNNRACSGSKRGAHHGALLRAGAPAQYTCKYQ